MIVTNKLNIFKVGWSVYVDDCDNIRTYCNNINICWWLWKYSELSQYSNRKYDSLIMVNNPVMEWDRCSIVLDTTVMLGPLKFSLRATIDHHGPSIHSGHLSIVAKTFYCNDNTIAEFEIIDSKNSSTAYVILYELIDLWVLDSNRSVGVWCWGGQTNDDPIESRTMWQNQLHHINLKVSPGIRFNNRQRGNE